MAPVAILCFHRVLPASRREGPDAPYFERQTALALDRFQALLDALDRRDAVLPPSALLAWTGGAAWPERPGVILTFDDGYADVLEVAAPELRRRGWTALLCVTTAAASGAQAGLPVDHWYAALRDLDRAEDRASFIDGPEKRAFVRATPEAQREMLVRLRAALAARGKATTPGEPALPPLLDAAGLATLSQAGWWLGAHGDTHALLPELDAPDAAAELARCRRFFPDHGLPAPAILAYPDGATCPRTEALAAAAGFTIGLALGSRFATAEDPPLRLPRLIPTNDPGWFERRLAPLFTGGGR